MKKILKFFLFILGLIIVGCYWWLSPYSIDTNQLRSIDIKSSNANLNAENRALISNKLDSILLNAMNLNDFIGVSTGIYSQEFGAWYASVGYKDIAGKIPPNQNTKFRLASVSKPMTAIAMMQLYEKGVIDLDVPIKTYLNWLEDSGKGYITVRQLLNHTSGIPHYKSTLDLLSFTQYGTLKEATNVFIDRELISPPGTSYLYTTFGYTILGAIIEEVTKMTFQQYMHNHIWLPAEMSNTDVEEHEKDYKNKASLYLKRKNTYVNSPQTNLSLKYPGGGVQSTAEDLIKFGQAILDYTLIDSSTLELMTSLTDTTAKESYGLGWNIKIDEDYGKIIEHGGSQAGASSFFQVYIDKKIVVPVISNNTYSDSEVYFLARDLSNLLLDTLNWNKSVNFYQPIKNELLQNYTGTFKLNDKTFVISTDNGQLYGQLHPYPKVPYYSKSGNEFFSRHFDGILKFNDVGVKVNSLKYSYKGSPEIYRK